jgi:hypothetical protein
LDLQAMNTDSSDITQLLVAHRRRDAAGRGMDRFTEERLRAQSFVLDTCLRQVAVINGSYANSCAEIDDPQIDWYRGSDAYSFLLQTATGLNSSIPGEPNVLGQFRHGWQQWRNNAGAEDVRRLHTMMHQLFTDSRGIRREYLQGIGGSSYGTLVRKLLNPTSDARVLFIGTGKLARSMLSLFRSCEIALWNHQPPGFALADEINVYAPEEAAAAAAWATHTVLTTPPDRLNDRRWAGLLGDATQGVVHLGRRSADPGIWSQWSGAGSYFCLDDVFELRNRQSSVRSLQIRRARNACELLATKQREAVNSCLPHSALA